MNGDEATSLFLCIQVRMMAKGFASGSYEVPRLAFVAGVCGWVTLHDWQWHFGASVHLSTEG